MFYTQHSRNTAMRVHKSADETEPNILPFWLPYYFHPARQRKPFSEFLTICLFRKRIYHYFNRPPKHQISVPKKKSIFTSNGEIYSVQEKWQGKHMSKHSIIKLMGLMNPNMGNTLCKYTWTKGFWRAEDHSIQGLWLWLFLFVYTF